MTLDRVSEDAIKGHFFFMLRHGGGSLVQRELAPQVTEGLFPVCFLYLHF